MMLKRTKIVATLGPSTDDEDTIEAMLRAGMNVVRINCSHGTWNDHQRRIEKVRECAHRLSVRVGVLADLQGPKIRITRFRCGKVFLKEGQIFVLNASLLDSAGHEEEVGLDYKGLPRDVSLGDVLFLDDGRITMKIKDIKGQKIICKVLLGGELSDHKGINLQGGGLSAQAITDKDIKDIQKASKCAVDYVALSFARGPEDVEKMRKLLKQAGSHAGIITKIERSDAVIAGVIDQLIRVSDGVMVARGDLAVEIGDAQVPAMQKNIIRRARSLDKPVITATQMMESMIESPIPTRAEVSDVANAVLDGTDAVMLSAETAVGSHPVAVIEAVNRVCLAVEKHPHTQVSKHRVECWFERVDEAVAMAAMYAANHMDIKGIVALTESGITPLWMSRIRSGLPIFALSSDRICNKMTLYRGVYPVVFDLKDHSLDEIQLKIITKLKFLDVVGSGDRLILTYADRQGLGQGVNAMRVIQV